MHRSLAPLLLAPATVAALLACGEPARLRARSGGDWASFSGVETSRTVSSPLTLSSCGAHDAPESLDEESRLCVHVQLDASVLERVELGTPLSVVGVMRVPGIQDEAPPVFTPGEGHTPLVLGAWGSTVCRRPAREGEVVQQVRGKLLLTRREETRLAGRLELVLEGDLAQTDCGFDPAVELDVPFELGR